MRLINEAGWVLVQQWEGLSLVAYRDQAGVWTIGYGHTGGVYKGERVTLSQATQLLSGDLVVFENEVQARAPSSTDNQFAAMVSLSFNIGVAGYRSSTVLREFKSGNFQLAANAFLLWDKIHVDGRLVLDQGLLNRRIAERALFLTL